MSKNLKKMAAVMLSLALSISIISMPAAAMPSYSFDTESTEGLVPAKEILFSENFNGSDDLGSLNDIWGAGTEGSNTMTLVSRISNTGTTSGFLFIPVSGGVTATNPEFLKTKIDTALKGEFAVEFKFNKTVNNTVGSNSVDKLFYGAGYTDGTNENIAIKLGIDENDKPYYIDSTGNKQFFFNTGVDWSESAYDFSSNWTWDEGDFSGVKNVTDVTSETKDWYTVKVNVNTNTSTYSVYLNGALCVKDAEFISADGHSWSDSGINVPYLMPTDWTIGIRYAYDDLKIYREPTGYNTIYANDFNSYSEVEEWNASSSNLDGIAGFGLNTYTGKGGRTLNVSNGKLNAVHNEQKGGAIILGPVAEDNMTISTDFSVAPFEEDSYVANSTTVLMFGKASIGQGVRIAVDKEGNIRMGRYQSALADSVLAVIEMDESYNLTLSADFDSNSCDIYLDNKLIAENFAFTSSGTIASGDDLMIGLGYHQSSATTVVSYDNLKVYTDSREKIFSSIYEEIKTPYPRTGYVVEEISLPAEVAGYEEYTITYSTDAEENFSIAQNGTTAVVKQIPTGQNFNLTATVTDENGEYAASRTFKVKVSAGPYVGITNLAESSTITAATRQIDSGATVIVGIFSGNKLVDAAIGTDSASISYAELEAGTYTVKAMAIRSFETLAPLCKVSQTGIEIPAES